MRIVALLLLLVPPAPVTALNAFFTPEGWVQLVWDLPADPNVVGVTILRERLDEFEGDVSIPLNAPVETWTDTAFDDDGVYRYWIQTRNAGGELSIAAYIEVFGDDHDDGDGEWFCFVGTGTTAFPGWGFGLAAFAALSLWSARKRR